MNQKQVIEKLKDTGIPTTGFSTKTIRGRKDIFVIENNQHRKGLKINVPERVDVSLRTSKRYRQAVIIVKEPERVFTEEVPLYEDCSRGSLEELSQNQLHELKTVVDIERTHVPNSSFKIISKKDREFNSDITIQVTAPATEICFLAGFDEEHSFICQLPETVNSVSQAHEILKPEGWNEDWVRVGEWFFEPLSDEESFTILNGRGSSSNDNVWDFEVTVTDPDGHEFRDLNDSDNHYAQFIFYAKSNLFTYAMGLIKDDRKTHKPVYLKGLHRIHRNREVFNTSERWD